MDGTRLKPAFYALRSGGWRDYVTILHLPYTLWHLSYIVIPAAMAPSFYLERLAGTLLAFFLAVGLAAHALDEMNGRPLQTTISEGVLLGIAVAGMLGALAIGVLAIITVSVWALPFVLFGALMVPAYNLEWWDGRLHSDWWFGVAWGAFPALVGYWAHAERLDFVALFVAAACFGLSLTQRVLSRHVRRLRRHTESVSGYIEASDGTLEAITIPFLLAPAELALRILGLSMVALAAGLLVARL